ncbi:MAG: hypothetical protein JKY52_03710, partial [Flavobacteriales bacterium]|nr:hypothetical protein [Flavobacteriales bacterium]
MLTLDATNVNLNYLWQDNSTSPTFAVTQPGTYWVEVANSCGNIADTLLVTYNPVLSIQLGSDTSLCVGQTLTLNVTTFGATYLWQDNSTSPTLDVAQSGTYWVEVANSCGTVADTITITFGVLLEVELGNDTLFCSGDTFTLAVTDMNSTYLWQDNSTSPTFDVTQAGTYWVQLTNSCGTSADTVEVISGALPMVELGADIILCSGDSLTLDVTNSNSAYLWNDSSADPTLSVTQSGIYWVEVTNNC